MLHLFSFTGAFILFSLCIRSGIVPVYFHDVNVSPVTADALALTGIQCPAAGALSAVGSFTRHAHPDDCRLYYACFDGVPREYGCPIGTVFMIGQTEGEGQCQNPKNVPGW